LNLRELFEVFHQRAGNGIERAIRLTTAREINMRDTIGECEFTVAGKTVEHKSKTFVAFNIAGTFEIFIEHGADQIL
jgi:hypothetical protein